MSGDTRNTASSCRASEVWLKDVTVDLRAQLAQGNALPADAPQTLSDRILELCIANDFDSLAVLRSSAANRGIWNGAILRVIEKIEQLWEDDGLDPMRVLNAFWTLRRAFDALSYDKVKAQAPGPDKPTVLIFTPAAEEHSFGAQMLMDQLLDLDLNAQLMLQQSRQTLLRALSTVHIDLLAISVGYDQSLWGLADLITDARAHSLAPKMPIIVGGRAFENGAEHYSFLGADDILTNHDKAPIRIHEWLRHSNKQGIPGHA